MELEEHLVSLEQELLNPRTRKEPARVEALLDDGFREFGSSGLVYDKRTILDALAGEPQGEIAMTDRTVNRLSETVVLLTYKTTKADASVSLRSSIWVLREGSWRIIFHQGTPLPRR